MSLLTSHKPEMGWVTCTLTSSFFASRNPLSAPPHCPCPFFCMPLCGYHRVSPFNAFHCVQGIRGIFAGVTPSVAAQVTENAILFMAYGYCQKAVMWATNTPRNEDLSLLSLAGCGSLASAFAALGLTPTELVKCRLQVWRGAGCRSRQKGGFSSGGS